MVQKLSGADSTRWDRLSRQFRRKNPLCAIHLQEGRIVAAEVVDHIRPHRGDRKLLFDLNNLQSLCKACHDSYKHSVEMRGYSKQVGADGWPIDPAHPVNKKKKFF